MKMHLNLFSLLKILIIYTVINHVNSVIQYKTLSELILTNNTNSKRIPLTFTNPNSNSFSLHGNLTLKFFIEKPNSLYFITPTDLNGSIWIINSEENYDFIIQNYIREEQKIAIIISNTFTIKHTKKKPSIFSVELKDMYELINVCYSNSPTATIMYKREILYYPLEYYIISTSTIILVSLILFFIVSKTRCKIHKRNLLSFHKMLHFLPFQMSLLGGFILIEIYIDCTNKINDIESDIFMFNKILYVLMYSIFKTFFWSTLLLMSYGWEITKNDLLSYEIKWFIFVYLIIYILFCSDKLFEIFFKDVYILIYSITEIKNIIIYISLFILTFIFSYKNIKLLHFTIQFVKLNQGEHHIPQLLYKIHMLQRFILLVFIYLIGYALFMSFQNIYFENYVDIDNSLFEIVNSAIFDCFFVIILIFLYYPVKLPRYFRVYFDLKLSNYNGKNYHCILPNKIQLITSNYFSSSLEDFEYDEKENKVIPLVIIKPAFFEDFETKPKYESLEDPEYSQQIIFDKVSLGYLKSYIKPIGSNNINNTTNDQTLESEI